MQIDPTITVNDIVDAFPSAVRILSTRGIDACCRGQESLAEAAKAVGLMPEALVREIVAAAATPSDAPSCSCGCASKAKR